MKHAKVILILALLGLIVGCSNNPNKIDQKRYVGLYRAAIAIESATEVGVNYLDFGKLLRDFNTELSLAKSLPEYGDLVGKDFEVVMFLSHFELALREYRWSHEEWKTKIESPDYLGKISDGYMQGRWSQGKMHLAKAKAMYHGKKALDIDKDEEKNKK